MMRRGEVSRKHKNNKHKTLAPEKQPSVQPASFVRSSIRKPGPAMLSLASVMLATSAMAQDGGALPTIDVQDTAGGGYQTTDSQLARIPTPLRDTPQTVNVVPKQVIQEQRITTMEDALRTVPGITFNAGEGGQQGDSPNIRGFSARGDVFRDGVRDPGWYTRDLFSSDRVEVYKGPSAFAFGRGSTGGAINIVSKLPTPVPYLEGTITGTSAGGYRAEVDANGKKDNVWGRISALYQDVPTPDRDNVYTRRWGVAPSVRIDLNQDTRVSLNYIYQGEESIPDYGRSYLPAPAYDKKTGALTNPGYYNNGRPTPPIPVPRGNWYGVVAGPLADVVKTEAHTITGKFEHDFTNDLKFSNTTRYVSVDRFARVTSPRSLLQADNATAVTPGYPVTQMTIGREHFQIETDNSLLINQTDLSGKFSTGSWVHTFSVGTEFAQETRDQMRAKGMTGRLLCDQTDPLCRTSAYYPVDTNFGGVFNGWNPPNSSISTTAAAYAFDQIKINEYFELLGSIRFDNFDTKYTDYSLPIATRESGRVDNMTSWRVGGVFHPTTNSSIYAAYGVSYNPSAEFATLSNDPTSTASAALPPERNRTIEVGAKADFLNNRLSLSGAIFRIEKNNMRIPIDPITNLVQVLDGTAKVDGIELGAVGSITDKWSVFAGYSYLDSEITKTSDLSQLGRELASTPHHNFTLWSTYVIDPQWTVGGGAIFQSDAFVNTTNTSYVPAYWRFDAMLAYKVTPNSTLQLNVYNLGDALYYAQYYGGHAVPASGRYASLSYRYRFEPPPAVKYDK